MDSKSYWALLRSGNIDEGLREVELAHSLQPDPSHIVEFSVAYLWAKKYKVASSLLQKAIQTEHPSLDSLYILAGTANWCAGESLEAVNHWRDGLDAQMADTSGLGVTAPLLLHFASIVMPSIFSGNEARQLLMEKAKDRRINRWWGPIVQLVIGQIGEPEIRQSCIGRSDFDTQRRHWLVDFYLGLIARANNDVGRYSELMRKTPEIPQQEGVTHDLFLRCLWHPEFFLARHEVETDNVDRK